MFHRILSQGCIALILGGVLAAYPVRAQTLSLDDHGVMPLHIGTTPGQGRGAEDEFGRTTSALAPSPSLALFPASALACRGDGALFSPGVPVNFFFNPNGGGIDAVSTNRAALAGTTQLHLDFSIDRKTTGAPGSTLATEAALNQQMGDIYGSTRPFTNPSAFVGTLPGGYGGVLSSAGGGGSNGLLINQGQPSTGVGALGLITGTSGGGAGNVVPAGVTTPTAASGTHDNVDGFDYASLVPNPGGPGGVFAVQSYFCITVDEARSTGWAFSMADIFTVAPYASNSFNNRWAMASTMGLNPYEDSIDGLVVFDMNQTGGLVEPGVDFALFSLAPGSLALSVLQRDAADVFFTDFTNSFAVYATPGDLGIVPSPGGAPFAGSNIDALEARPVPEPGLLWLPLTGLALLRRRH